MSVSGIGNYRDTLYSWQSQQLKSTGNSTSNSKAANSLSSLFNGSSMTNQLSGMIELTRYAMDAMGVSADSRVTFSQISKYRQKLQDEFSAGVKKGLAESGISDLNGLAFSLAKDAAISVSGANAQDRKAAQAWLDANPSFGKDLRSRLEKGGIEASTTNFRLSSAGKISLVDNASQNIQSSLDKFPELTENLREVLNTSNTNSSSPIDLKFSDDGKLQASGDSKEAQAINAWLGENSEFTDKISTILKEKDISYSAVSLRLGTTGNLQISVNNADNNDIQNILDESSDIGKNLITGLSSLGIDQNINFSIKISDDGGYEIISDHADKDKLKTFFENNPELIKKYKQIETLAGIDDARKAMQISSSEMRKRIQIESMAAWWVNSDDATSYFGQYGSGNFSLLSGLNMKV